MTLATLSRIAPLLLGMVVGACQSDGTGADIEMADDDIAGVVTSSEGPEAGVWVIAETDDVGTRFARTGVTDDEGRYLIPDLPEASYRIWVRGYGLVDSEAVLAERGQRANSRASVAPSAEAAARVYPAAYWFSMMDLPTREAVATLDVGMEFYLTWVKNMGCVGCHQLGNEATRTCPEALAGIASFEEAWARRISSGQAGGNMMGIATRTLHGRRLEYLAQWTDRVAAGELPAHVPERPSGTERNVVATVRDWSSGSNRPPVAGV